MLVEPAVPGAEKLCSVSQERDRAPVAPMTRPGSHILLRPSVPASQPANNHFCSGKTRLGTNLESTREASVSGQSKKIIKRNACW